MDRESPLIDKITQDWGSQIIETTVKYSIKNNKTWNTYKLRSILLTKLLYSHSYKWNPRYYLEVYSKRNFEVKTVTWSNNEQTCLHPKAKVLIIFGNKILSLK